MDENTRQTDPAVAAASLPKIHLDTNVLPPTADLSALLPNGTAWLEFQHPATDSAQSTTDYTFSIEPRRGGKRWLLLAFGNQVCQGGCVGSTYQALLADLGRYLEFQAKGADIICIVMQKLNPRGLTIPIERTPE